MVVRIKQEKYLEKCLEITPSMYQALNKVDFDFLIKNKR